ncbi:HD-GYP domain-containing protein [Permianibacter sp. IMCC34836]|uniref:HD-GYP domain-containing protein n=1 Tax=Permianibacter fluminis TaxID=2738515 RepID=UPI0015536FD1|nr:HD-GYP domain-containing protein [Permianibacter fluminis]NQD38151.1 HD-GYP domain-containing protein [Permianibacter fluminis]
MNNRQRISVSELRLGMCVIDLDRPWLETPFLIQGFILSTEADIKAVQQYCRYVYIDPRRGALPTSSKDRGQQNLDRNSSFSLFQRSEPPAPKRAVEEELPDARKVHARGSSLVRGFMDDIRFGRVLNVKAIEEGVADTVDSVLRNPDAMMWLAQLRKKDASHEQHCLNACILAVTFGRHLGLPRDELQKLGICALLHDVGKLQIPDAVLNKTGPLSEAELATMRKHTDFGRVILMSARELYHGAIDVAHSHHEWVDGTGYPRGLNGGQISPFAKIIAIVDTYDDIIGEHVYRGERTAFEALKEINAGRGKQFDESLVKHFIDMIGVFPVGSIVELGSGEVGIVLAQTPNKPMLPRVVLLLDANKQPRKEQILNLAMPAAEGAPAHRVVRVLRRGDYGLDPQQLQERGLMAKIP